MPASSKQRPEPEVILFDSDEAAQRTTLEGWVSRDGNFYADDDYSSVDLGGRRIIK
jgi:hypothetical protein